MTKLAGKATAENSAVEMASRLVPSRRPRRAFFSEVLASLMVNPSRISLAAV